MAGFSQGLLGKYFQYPWLYSWSRSVGNRKLANLHRATQIDYQQAGREFTADRDRVANALRSVLRQLELSRLNFQIARQQVVAASRQIDEAQNALRSSRGSEANLTLCLLRALQGVLDTQHKLVSNWVTYEISTLSIPRQQGDLRRGVPTRRAMQPATPIQARKRRIPKRWRLRSWTAAGWEASHFPPTQAQVPINPDPTKGWSCPAFRIRVSSTVALTRALKAAARPIPRPLSARITCDSPVGRVSSMPLAFSP